MKLDGHSSVRKSDGSETQTSMTLLAFETSCDETSAAVVRDGCVLASVVSTQIKLHAEYGGVVPELATREHLKNLLPLARTALRESGTSAGQIEAVAATQGPGLPNALMIGLKAAQGVAFALGRPFLGVHHHEAHLYSPWITGEPPRADFGAFQPNLALIVSGGHTMLIHVQAELKHRLLGGTLDDAAGECFDKSGKLLGLAYPAGPEIDRLAEQGNPAAFAFPRPLLHDPNDDFSFSGLKTAVMLQVKNRALDAQARADVAAEFQAAIVDVLVAKSIAALARGGLTRLVVAGGVGANRELRAKLTAAAAPAGCEVFYPAPEFCTDNGAMIAFAAAMRLRNAPLQRQATDAQGFSVRPRWDLSALEPVSA